MCTAASTLYQWKLDFTLSIGALEAERHPGLGIKHTVVGVFDACSTEFVRIALHHLHQLRASRALNAIETGRLHKGGRQGPERRAYERNVGWVRTRKDGNVGNEEEGEGGRRGKGERRQETQRKSSVSEFIRQEKGNPQ